MGDDSSGDSSSVSREHSSPDSSQDSSPDSNQDPGQDTNVTRKVDDSSKDLSTAGTAGIAVAAGAAGAIDSGEEMVTGTDAKPLLSGGDVDKCFYVKGMETCDKGGCCAKGDLCAKGDCANKCGKLAAGVVAVPVAACLCAAHLALWYLHKRRWN